MRRSPCRNARPARRVRAQALDTAAPVDPCAESSAGQGASASRPHHPLIRSQPWQRCTDQDRVGHRDGARILRISAAASSVHRSGSRRPPRPPHLPAPRKRAICSATRERDSTRGPGRHLATPFGAANSAESRTPQPLRACPAPPITTVALAVGAAGGRHVNEHRLAHDRAEPTRT